MEILAIVPARGGSKGIPNKNIYPINGYPLIQYTINAIQESKLINRAILTSDSEEIISVAKECGLEVPFKRPSELARDHTPAIPVIEHSLDTLQKIDGYVPDVIILLQPTSPLRTSQHIDSAIEKFVSSNADSLVSVTEVPHQYAPHSVMSLNDGYLESFIKYEESKNLRQLKPKFFARNGAAIYLFKTDTLLKKKSIFGDTILPFLMKKEDSIDIDDAFDLKLCEFILKERK